MMKIGFQTRIPKPVQDWIYEREFEDHLLEAENRLKRALSHVPQFNVTGEVHGVKLIETKELIGDCSVVVEGNTEEEARADFKKHFGLAAKKQKFRLTSFKNID
jgi:hypothetical protein